MTTKRDRKKGVLMQLLQQQDKPAEQHGEDQPPIQPIVEHVPLEPPNPDPEVDPEPVLDPELVLDLDAAIKRAEDNALPEPEAPNPATETTRIQPPAGDNSAETSRRTQRRSEPEQLPDLPNDYIMKCVRSSVTQTPSSLKHFIEIAWGAYRLHITQTGRYLSDVRWTDAEGKLLRKIKSVSVKGALEALDVKGEQFTQAYEAFNKLRTELMRTDCFKKLLAEKEQQNQRSS